MDQALGTRDAEEQVGHREFVQEEIVVGHVESADNHTFDA
jgi:hypothetical protein